MIVLSRSMNADVTSVLKDLDMAKTLMSSILDMNVVVPTNKAQNNIVFCLQDTLHPMCIIGGRHIK